MVNIVPAREEDAADIQAIYSELHRPPREKLEIDEYLVARRGGELLGCAAVHVVPCAPEIEGYLYGLAVRKKAQRCGIGRALTEARVERVQALRGVRVVALAMFWNVNFFRRLGFITSPRGSLSELMRALPDFTNPRYRRSAAMCRLLTC
jgi:N-acetylglutamate synthase-like GNAT family acetyltransferase